MLSEVSWSSIGREDLRRSQRVNLSLVGGYVFVHLKKRVTNCFISSCKMLKVVPLMESLCGSCWTRPLYKFILVVLIIVGL